MTMSRNSAHVQYAPVPHVDYEHESANHSEMTHPGSDIQNGHKAHSHHAPSNTTTAHTSGHKNFATFSAVPVKENGRNSRSSDLFYNCHAK
jgi:hypothetical protein